jgi:hypothetical protein
MTHITDDPKSTPAYRYMSLNHFDRVDDIFSHNRFYAPKYCELNDPMEGYFVTLKKTHKDRRKKIKKILKQRRILCFSKKYNDVLLWAHYANGFKGICIKVEIEPCNGNEVLEVNYDMFPFSYILSNDLDDEYDNGWPRKVFKEKAKPWTYEDEIRILTENKYVACPLPIKIEAVYFGVRIDPQLKKKLLSIIPANIECYNTRISEDEDGVVLCRRRVRGSINGATLNPD